MRWHLSPMQESFPRVTAAWDRLNTEVLGGHPLFDSRFVGPLVRYFGHPEDLLAVRSARVGRAYASRADEPDGILLLKRKRLGWSTFLPAQTQVAPLLMKQAVDPLALLRDLPGINLSVDFSCQDPLYSPWLRGTERYVMRTMTHAVTMNLEMSGSFADFMKTRSKNLRENMKRKLKKPEREGLPVEMRVLDSPDEMAAAIERYGAIETHGWKGRMGTAVNVHNTQGKFYSEILTRFAESGQAAVYEVYVGERLAASKLTLNNDWMIINLKKAYEQELGEYSPGRLLDYLQVQREFEARRFRVMEFYTNAAADQLSWATGTREIRHHSFYRHVALAAVHDYIRSRHQPAGDRGRTAAEAAHG